MDKTPIVLSWLLTHFLVCIIHIRVLLSTNNIWITLYSIILMGVIHNYIKKHFSKVYTDIKRKEENCQATLGDCGLHIFIVNRMPTFKIKLEDKAAFLNRLEKAEVALDTNQIKDDKLKGYFEVTSDNLEQIEQIKTILKQSPKINTIKEMKSKLTRSDLKEMVRRELRNVLAEKKERVNEDLFFTPLLGALAIVGISLLAPYVEDTLQTRSKWKKVKADAIADAVAGKREFTAADEAELRKKFDKIRAAELEASNRPASLSSYEKKLFGKGDDSFFE